MCIAVLITGPDEACVGTETALALAAGSPACIIFADYSWHNVQTVIYRISATQPDVVTLFITLDLSSQNAIRNAAATINQSVHSIDILINNAGIMACPFARNVDWIESQFGYYIGHFLLTNLIMERLIAGQGARIVNVSNSGHRMSDVRLYNWNFQVCRPRYCVTADVGFADAFKHGFEYNAWSAYVRIYHF